MAQAGLLGVTPQSLPLIPVSDLEEILQVSGQVPRDPSSLRLWRGNRGAWSRGGLGCDGHEEMGIAPMCAFAKTQDWP